MGSRVRVPSAPQLEKAKLGKALIPNGIRAFFVSGRKQNPVVLRSKSGAKMVAFFRPPKNATKMYYISLIFIFLRRFVLLHKN